MDAFASNPWLAALAGVTSVVTVVGNAAVLAAVASRRNLRAVRSNLFIASMGEFGGRTFCQRTQGGQPTILMDHYLLGKNFVN